MLSLQTPPHSSEQSGRRIIYQLSNRKHNRGRPQHIPDLLRARLHQHNTTEEELSCREPQPEARGSPSRPRTRPEPRPGPAPTPASSAPIAAAAASLPASNRAEKSRTPQKSTRSSPKPTRSPQPPPLTFPFRGLPLTNSVTRLMLRRRRPAPPAAEPGRQRSPSDGNGDQSQPSRRPMRNASHRQGGEMMGRRVGGRRRRCQQPIKGGVGSLKPSAARDWFALSRGRGSRHRPLLSKWHRGARVTVSESPRFERERRERLKGRRAAEGSGGCGEGSGKL